MPVAVANTNEVERIDLKSCPGGFVSLRRMTFGQSVRRRAMMKLSLLSDAQDTGLAGEMAMASLEITHFEYTNCIVEHNLEKTEGVLLDFRSPVDVDSLDPRIGQEIELNINRMNNFDDKETEGN